MKSQLALILCSILVTFAVEAFTAEWDKYKTYVATDKEDIYSTWVNPDVKAGHSQKRTYKADSVVEWFVSANSAAPDYVGRYLIISKWKDSEGNIWYKTHAVDPHYQYFSLIKISNSGDTLEIVEDLNDYPRKIDPNHVNYDIYSREQRP